MPLFFHFFSEKISSLAWKCPQPHFSIWKPYSVLHSISISEFEHSCSFPKDNLGFTYKSWKKPAGIMKRKARLRSPTHRKVSMLTQATIQALANHPPKWTSPVWYCNVFRSSRNFKKTNPELLSTEKPWNIHRRFSSCYNKKNITGEKQAHNTCEYQPN